MSTATITTAEQLWQNHPQGRCELVRGELRTYEYHGMLHGWVAVNVSVPLFQFIREHRLGIATAAGTGFIIHRDPDSVRAPDGAFVRRERIVGEPAPGFFDGPPDLAIEVLSPDDTASAVDEKAEDWLTSGCQEVWIVDPQRRTASQCTWADDAVVRRSVEQLKSPLLPGFNLTVAELFQR